MGGSGRLKHLDQIGGSPLAQLADEYRLTLMRKNLITIDYGNNIASMSLLQSACKKTETMTRMSTDGLHAEEVLIQDLKTLLGDSSISS
jgi:hypothetical protein